MERLNLPEASLKIVQGAKSLEIFDIVRKKYLVLTPEEWVRQNFMHFLINHLDYPKPLFALESGLKYNKLTKRSDILVMNNKGENLLLVECKASKVKLDQKVFHQIEAYNQIIKAQYIILTNGIQHICCHYNNNQYTQIHQFPAYSSSL
ncbi:type I restriction enzyme HsdR N-terminal domain-containing protein [Aureibacter tunicatorum]|uniref:Type I restriction enzyme R protein N-terminal domain-containing protein n=1 Tax=Aureibacter tunicatorum TaxID=866807 RepID=A0AAE3XPQ7_9BACT|nr:type I restriction enzyme HsdR N-terminal domain-containing protein [Aureibacter tunicatorum]MDR6239775.1 hypothetical protein [Aureibacter tunicatorum]BDD04250.1 restriction endonuclease subunit R [Aureibacter tunicatorum]